METSTLLYKLVVQAHVLGFPCYICKLFALLICILTFLLIFLDKRRTLFPHQNVNKYAIIINQSFTYLIVNQVVGRFNNKLNK